MVNGVRLPQFGKYGCDLMTGFEKRTVLSLAALYSMRMLGLFMVLPVFVIFGKELEGATELLMGLAIGAYGLSQSLLQIPFGMMSDRVGRKRMLIIGLIIFAAGSVVAAVSTSIYGVIAGRFLQGAGAIASVLMALLSDLTLEESRTKAMAVIGMSIGLSFSVALVLGPVVAAYTGLTGIFALTAIFAVAGIALVIWVIPTPVKSRKHRDTLPVLADIKQTIGHSQLRRLDFGIFVLHMVLTAVFVALPLAMIERAGIEKDEHWWIYLSVMVVAFFSMVPFIIVGEKMRKMKQVFVGAIALLIAGLLMLTFFGESLGQVWFGLFVFFMAFNLLEATLPSLVSKLSPAGAKGTAMGVYSTCQFFGAFCGGAIGGWMLGVFGIQAVFIAGAVFVFFWLAYAITMDSPSYATSFMLKLSLQPDAQQAELISGELASIDGVEDVVIVIEEQAAYLKVDSKRLDENALRSYRFALNA
jgi:MFS family permease